MLGCQGSAKVWCVRGMWPNQQPQAHCDMLGRLPWISCRSLPDSICRSDGTFHRDFAGGSFCTPRQGMFSCTPQWCGRRSSKQQTSAKAAASRKQASLRWQLLKDTKAQASRAGGRHSVECERMPTGAGVASTLHASRLRDETDHLGHSCRQLRHSAESTSIAQTSHPHPCREQSICWAELGFIHKCRQKPRWTPENK